MPADLADTDSKHPHNGSVRFDQRRIFHELLPADEVDRAPAKVQSAL